MHEDTSSFHNITRDELSNNATTILKCPMLSNYLSCMPLLNPSLMWMLYEAIDKIHEVLIKNSKET
jgi:hypothetical protein